MMRIGVDFDNTIVCYDDVFYQAARLQGLIPSHIARSKGAVRDYLRSIGKENTWTELQGTVYGARMDLPQPFPHVADFFQICSEKQIPTCIISHKTLYPYLGPQHNLHDAAKKWLSAQHFVGLSQVHFELTLTQKLSRIADLQCTHFIDDLPELLAEKNFPTHVQKVLFDPNNQYSDGPYLRMRSWKEIIERLFPS